jgi:hypothetical protein
VDLQTSVLDAYQIVTFFVQFRAAESHTISTAKFVATLCYVAQLFLQHRVRSAGWDRIITNSEQQTRWTEAVVAGLRVLSRHSPGGTEETKNIFSQKCR